LKKIRLELTAKANDYVRLFALCVPKTSHADLSSASKPLELKFDLWNLWIICLHRKATDPLAKASSLLKIHDHAQTHNTR